jgi:hypothetical protein
MPATLEHEGDDVYLVKASGMLAKSELEAVEAAMVPVLARGKIRLLILLERFEGWKRGDDWSDMHFYETHGASVERIAIVGEEKWRADAQVFLLAGLRAAPVRFFGAGELEQARGWLSL